VTARDEILAALMRGAPASAPDMSDVEAQLAPLLGRGTVDASALERFRTRARESGTEIEDCADIGAAADLLARRYASASTLLLAEDSHTDRFELGAALDAALPLVSREPVSRDGETPDARNRRYLGAAAGICGAFGGLADSGAVAVCTSAGQPRALSLLPDDSVVLLRRDDVMTDLSCLQERVADMFGNEATSAITLIGGPSRTADIEKVLVNGVHGPRRLLVCLIG
jgi:L-lactate utilization protein LutC